MIYLDHAATTKPCQEAVRAAVEAAEQFGNPSSLHRLGMDAEKIVENSRTVLAKRLGVDKKNFYFTSGGTEANNTAIIGWAMANRKTGTHLITTKIEHPSVTEAFKYLENEGFTVTWLSPDRDGVVPVSSLEEAMTDKTILVSMMHVNNETGMIQPVDKLKPVIKRIAPRCALHTDMVQSFCKIPCQPKKWGIDMVSVSSHKIRGIKGVGGLYLENPRIRPLLSGGGQQRGIRPGTENVPGIAAFGAAAETAKENGERIHALRAMLKDGILRRIDRVKINGCDEHSAGNILNVSFLGIKAEILLHSLERKEIYVSTGSACSTHKPQPSPVLDAMGLSAQEIAGALRLSFDEALTQEQIAVVLDALAEEVETIRKYVR